MLRQRSIALTSLFLIFTLYYAKHSPPPLHFSLALSLPLPVSSPLLLSEIQSELCSTSESKRKISLIWTPADPEDVCASGCACVRARAGGEGWEAIGILILCEKKRVCANMGPAPTVKPKAVLMPLSSSCKTGSYLLS